MKKQQSKGKIVSGLIFSPQAYLEVATSSTSFIVRVCISNRSFVGNELVIDLSVVALTLKVDKITIDKTISTEGYVHIPQTPGIGISLNEDAVERFRVD